ncbi:DNA-binding CsgD family transcriptional regulator [Providencia alcalifaciens]|nr:DNA-binding CsgD family transcriptional regulator [Providencia alcalifaciens]
MKVDFCTQYGDIFEITSINSKKNLSLSDMMAIYKYRPIIADYAHKIWSQDPKIVLPVRANILLSPDEMKNKDRTSSELLDSHQYMRFGNIRFTRKEVITIKLFLSHCRVKEISAIQGCSEASEHKRIQRIKEKLNCPYVSSSGLFNVLKEQGITLACLDIFISVI